MMTCIFFGTQNPMHFKNLRHSFVLRMVQRQKAAGISDPIVNHMCSLLAATHNNDIQNVKKEDSENGNKDIKCKDDHNDDHSNGEDDGDGEDHGNGEDDGDGEDDGNAEDDGFGEDKIKGKAYGFEEDKNKGKADGNGEDDGNIEDDDYGEGQIVCSCMCCYYWVARRQKQELVPFPMQNLLSFVRTLIGSESKKCDSRILLRLVRTIIIEGNMYSMFFEHCELEGMREIVKIADEQASQICVQYDSKGKLRKKRKSQGNALFCVKEHLAQLWHLNNGQSILLPNRQATDLLR